MNVAFDPWIPVVTDTGERKLVSLCDVLTDGKRFADLAVRPHERVSLMRLFLCVVHAALDGPKDYEEWLEVPKRLPDAARAYLTKWKDSFELFHRTKPWLQVAELSKTPKNVGSPDENLGSPDDVSDWTSVSKLVFSFATGSNTTLFDHEGMMQDSRIIPIYETIIALISFQCFSVGGLMGQVFWNSIRCGQLANPKMENGPVKSCDGPCVPASMIHAFIRGVDLLQSIHLNTPTYEDVRFVYGERPTGRPVWEMMPTSMSDKVRVENATETYVGRLVPLTRVIRLHPSGKQMLLGDGLLYPPYTAGFPPEPTATVVIRKNNKKEERSLLSYRPTKSLWRELSALIVKRTADGMGGSLSLRAIRDGDDCDLTVAALARDKATIVDTVESVFHIPSRLRTGDGIATYEFEVKQAELRASRLGWAVEGYREEVDGGWAGRIKGAGPSKGELKAKLHSIATTHYWTAVEKNLSVLLTHIEAIGTDNVKPTQDAWRKMIFESACDAYRVACGQETPRHMKAFAKGWQKLTSKKGDTETDSPDEKEENNELAS